MSAAYAVVAPLVTVIPLRQIESFRIELGASDDAFLLGNDSAWGRAYRDSGPFRVRRGQRTMTYFAARQAYPGAGIRVPARVSDGDGELQLRAHRYGRPGIIHVFGNGIHLGSLVFVHDTYPWEVFQLRVPAATFRSDGLEVELRGDEADPDIALDSGALVALDYVDLIPRDESDTRVRLAPHVSVLALALPAAILLTLWWGGLSPTLSAGVVTLATGAVVTGLAKAPGPTSGALEHLFLVAPIGLVVYAVLRRPLHVDAGLARGLTAGFSLVVLAHATIIFFPNHQPPDLGPHLGQIGRMGDSRFAGGDFWEFSSSYGVDGRGKPHFGADYEAPYPPWTYAIVHVLRKALNHSRFWLELVGMTCAGLMALLSFALARRFSTNPCAATFAFILMAIEISTWHHASRVHVPGMLGGVFFLMAITYLAYRFEQLERWSVLLGFAFLSMLATLAYTATLFHFVFFMIWFTVLELFERRSPLPSATTLRAVAASSTGTLGSFAVFYHRFVAPALASKDAILAYEGYRAPATFFFLRNQMRDTAKILSLGYPWFVALALPAYVRLKEWSQGALSRRIILAWTATYVMLLVLKDPVFFPQLFLHVKEDLLFAPLACILGAMTLSAAWSSPGKLKKWAVGAVLVFLLVLQARDYLYNADTIAVWAASQR